MTSQNPAASSVKMRCPNCGVNVRGRAELFNRPVTCPKCKAQGTFLSAEEQPRRDTNESPPITATPQGPAPSRQLRLRTLSKMNRQTRRILLIAGGIFLAVCVGIGVGIAIWRGPGSVSYDNFESRVLVLLAEDSTVASRLGTPITFREVESAPGIHPKPGQPVPGDIYAHGCRSLLKITGKATEVYCALFIEGPQGKGTAGVKLRGDDKSGRIISLAVEYSDGTVTTVVGPANVRSVQVKASVSDGYSSDS